MRFPTARDARYLLVVGALLFVTLLVYWHSWPRREPSLPSTGLPTDSGSEHPPCRNLAGSEDILMVMKTGATELQDKLTVHLHTTLTCYPHYLIFSDYEEDVNGQHIFDALKYVSPSIRNTHQDFELWRRLQKKGRAGLKPSELSGIDSSYKDETIRLEKPGWKLDKWKFLPMMNRTLHLQPAKHWYVFVETDTYVLWPSLLPYLNAKSWEQQHYIGSRTGHEDVLFAHGGSGYVLSRPALEKVVNLFSETQEEWEAFTDRYRVGDHILGAALRKAGVGVEQASPTWQGEPVGLLEFHSGRDGLWCQNAISFHHESPQSIKDLWHFEQDWIAEAAGLPDMTVTEPRPIRHKDVFERYVLPRIQQPLEDWNNTSDESRGSSSSSLLECEAMCQDDPACLQYALHDGGDCRTLSRVVFGDTATGVRSGWMPARVREYLERQGTC